MTVNSLTENPPDSDCTSKTLSDIIPLYSDADGYMRNDITNKLIYSISKNDSRDYTQIRQTFFVSKKLVWWFYL